MNILCIGDSNSWGFSYNELGREDCRWPVVLQKLLIENKYIVKEECLNGRCIYSESKNNLSLIDNVEEILNKYSKIYTVVIMLGTNDFSISENKEVDEVMLKLLKILESVEKYYINNFDYVPHIVFITPPNINVDIKNRDIVFNDFNFESYKKLLKFNRRIENYLEINMPATYVFNNTGFLEAARRDCIHLDRKGHELLAEKLYSFLKERIL